MLVTNQIILIKSRIQEICIYSFSYIMHFRSYYINPILYPYSMSWIGFLSPQIEPILYLYTINSAIMIYYFLL